MKNAYKRSRWLLNPIDNGVKSDVLIQSEQVSNDETDRVTLLGEPLGNLHVKSVSLYPKELEMGIWPPGYDLSDHGLVEVVFTSD